MSKLLFRMRNVPEDEAQEVRDLLKQNEIEYFETFAGNWGISMPAIWVQHKEQYATARSLLDDYQLARSSRIRSEYEMNRQKGETRTTWHSFYENPLRFIVYIGLAVVVLLFSLRVFMVF